MSAVIDMFRSTPACERATTILAKIEIHGGCFDPRPRVSGRPSRSAGGISMSSFRSTPACERATRRARVSFPGSEVSIHARV